MLLLNCKQKRAVSRSSIRESSVPPFKRIGNERTKIKLAPGKQYEYLQERLNDDRHKDSEFVFTSQRSGRLTEAGIHHWLRTLKEEKATKGEWELIKDITFHDLRHDFAHRCREAGWTLEEIAYYLGHITKQGAPAIQTTARYTQVSREQIKEKLKLLT